MREEITPRIYVGVGGTGRRMVALIKKRIEESGLTAEEKKANQFLAIDADKYQRDDCYPLDELREFLHVGGFDPGEALDSDQLKGPLRDWWYEGYRPPYVQQGAGAVRLVGRLCLYYHYPRVRDALIEAVQRATDFGPGRRVSNEITVYIVGSLAGGTGSAMFLDLGFMARRCFSFKQVYVNAVVMLPDIFTVTQVRSQQHFKDRWMANGYAALKELRYFNEHPQEFTPYYRSSLGREPAVKHNRLFDRCLLIEPVMGNTSTVSSNGDIFEWAAHSLYLYSASVHGAHSGSVLVNTDGTGYASIGMQAIEFPRRWVLGYARHHATAQFLEGAFALIDEEAVRQDLGQFVAANNWVSVLERVSELAQETIRRPDLDSDDDLARQAQRARDDFEQKLREHRRRLDEGKHELARGFLELVEANLRRHGEDEGSLSWCRTFLRSLVFELQRQMRDLEAGPGGEQQIRRLEEQIAEPKQTGPIGRLLKRHLQIKEKLESDLYNLYARYLIPNEEVAAAKEVVGTILTTLQRWESRMERLIAADTSAMITEQKRLAKRFADDLTEVQHRSPHVRYSVRGEQVHQLVTAMGKQVTVGKAPAAELWRWVMATGAEDNLDAVVARIARYFEQAFQAQSGLDLLTSCEFMGNRAELKDWFREVAVTCKPFWSYVSELAHEKMTKVSVLSMPLDSTWDEWLKETSENLKVVHGDRDHVVFLTVEGCDNLRDVHLKELPTWLRAYEQLIRAYAFGEDRRPLHIDEGYQYLDEVDTTLPRNPGLLFGPARRLSLIYEAKPGGQQGFYLSRADLLGSSKAEVPDMALGREPLQAMEVMNSLDESVAVPLWKYMNGYKRRVTKENWDHEMRPLVDYLRRTPNPDRLTGVDRAEYMEIFMFVDEVYRSLHGEGFPLRQPE